MIAREVCYHRHCITKFSNKFLKFCNDQQNHLNDVQKSLEVIAIVECMSFSEDVILQSSDEVAHFIYLSAI